MGSCWHSAGDTTGPRTRGYRDSGGANAENRALLLCRLNFGRQHNTCSANICHKHARRMTPALYASLVACAASHAPLVGSRVWGLSMRAKKGWRTRERRQAQREADLAEIRATNAGKARVSYGLGGI